MAILPVFGRKGLDGHALLGQPLKQPQCRNFNHFSIMFNYIFCTTYQRIKDLFYSDIFLDNRTLCLMNAVCVPARRFSTSKFEQFRNCNRIRFYFLTITWLGLAIIRPIINNVIFKVNVFLESHFQHPQALKNIHILENR